MLIVEDNETTKWLVEMSFRNKFSIYFAESVFEAKKELNKNVFDVVILDLLLKGEEHGFTLVTYIRTVMKIQPKIVYYSALENGRNYDVYDIPFVRKGGVITELKEAVKQLTE